MIHVRTYERCSEGKDSPNWGLSFEALRGFYVRGSSAVGPLFKKSWAPFMKNTDGTSHASCLSDSSTYDLVVQLLWYFGVQLETRPLSEASTFAARKQAQSVDAAWS